MKCLILGASGFIGRHLTRELINNKQEVTAFDRVKPVEFDESQVTFVEGNFSNAYDFASLVDHQDIVFHLISTTLPSTKIDLSQEISENIFSTLALLDACVEKGIKRVVFMSSGGTVYGKYKGHAFREDDETSPISSYGIQKLMIEKYLELYYHRYGLDYRAIRLSNPYGLGQNPNGEVGAITVFLNKILNDQQITIFGDGGNVRDYIYIEDAIKGIVNIASLDSDEKIFNLGSGKGTSLNAIVSYLESNLEKKAKIVFQDKRETDVSYSVLDISRYRNYFSNHQIALVEEGLKKYLDAMKKENEHEN